MRQFDLLGSFSQALHMLMDTPVAYRRSPPRSHLARRLIRCRCTGGISQSALQFRTQALISFEPPQVASRTNPLTQRRTVSMPNPQTDHARNGDQLQVAPTNVFQTLAGLWAHPRQCICMVLQAFLKSLPRPFPALSQDVLLQFT